MPKRKAMGEDSFLYWAYKNDIPVVVPGIMDGAVGSLLMVSAIVFGPLGLIMVTKSFKPLIKAGN